MNFKIQTPSRTANPSIPDLFRLQSYEYDLPEALIAQEPVPDRSNARLLVVDRAQGTIRHDTFRNVHQYLPPEACFVVNNSKVIPARLLGNRETGGRVEMFLLKSLPDGFCFEVLIRPLKRVRVGEHIHFSTGISAEIKDKERRIVRFNRRNVLEVLEQVGHIPLPPYIKRPATRADFHDYQTVYARRPGSVACPTAGLHFSKELMESLKARGHRFLQLTLHINYATFKPVECEDIRQHPMHREPYSVGASVYERILQLRQESCPIVAVGTTACRVLETLGRAKVCRGTSNLFIYPGFRFRRTDHLITNFHLPYSTLLMLVCAFGGYDLIMRAYHEAIRERYRFYSYGDAMLVL